MRYPDHGAIRLFHFLPSGQFTGQAKPATRTDTEAILRHSARVVSYQAVDFGMVMTWDFAAQFLVSGQGAMSGAIVTQLVTEVGGLYGKLDARCRPGPAALRLRRAPAEAVWSRPPAADMQVAGVFDGRDDGGVVAYALVRPAQFRRTTAYCIKPGKSGTRRGLSARAGRPGGSRNRDKGTRPKYPGPKDRGKCPPCKQGILL
jgi:hypothetical protein